MDASELLFFDSAHFAEMTGGDPEFQKDISGLYVETVAGLLQDLEKTTELEECRRIAHRIKGASLNIGFQKLGMLAGEAEQEMVQENLPAFRLSLEQAFQEVRILLEQQPFYSGSAG